MQNDNTTPNSFGMNDGDKSKPNYDFSIFNLDKRERISHDEILNKIIEKLEPIDFKNIANPDGVPNFKIKNKHLIIITIEEILRCAYVNRWGLCKRTGFIYLCNGEYWKEIEMEELQRFLGEAAEKLGVDKFNSKHYQFKEHLLKQFCSSAYIPLHPTGQDKVLINLRNGTFEIDENGGRLRPFSSSDFLTYQLPFGYDVTAKAPLFERFLNRVLPDVDKQKVLAEYLAYIFFRNGTQSIKEEKMLVLYGTGCNGKSVVYEIVNALLGRENVSNYSLEKVTKDIGYTRAVLANKLLNYVSEINKNIDTDAFKQLVSGERVEARVIYSAPFIMERYAKFMANCNELPKDVEQTQAFFRRFLLIHFDVTIPEAEIDKELHTKIIKSELSGVFNWVLDGLSRFLKQKGFTHSAAIQKANDDYRRDSDSVQLFLTDNEFEFSESNSYALKDIYSEYKIYCQDCCYKPCSHKTFSERLKGKGFSVIRKAQGMMVNAVKKSFF